MIHTRNKKRERFTHTKAEREKEDKIFDGKKESIFYLLYVTPYIVMFPITWQHSIVLFLWIPMDSNKGVLLLNK